jgi:hypothetical protein
MMLWGQNLAEQMGSGEEGSPDACLRRFTNRQARGPHKATWNQEAFSIVALMALYGQHIEAESLCSSESELQNMSAKGWKRCDMVYPAARQPIK